MRYGTLALALAAALLAAGTDGALAGPATVEGVEVRQEPSGTWRFDVTVRHADTGWDHYANAFTVTTVDGAPLGTRTLFHPHVEEQPFTRSLNGVAIPDGVTEVLVRAVDSVHGEGEPVRVLLNQ
ncbi:MAG: hypothetical protein AAGB11_19500 [Pseudomonadota bacterium]